jgi:gluconokinase
MDPWFLGIDLGTGSCKCVVTDEKAQILGFGAGDYTGATAQQKWNEQDPKSILAGMIRSVQIAVEQAGVKANACQALSIGGALHSLMALDRSGKPLTGVFTWADGRGSRQALAIRRTLQAAELYSHSGCPVHGIYPLYKILWLSQEKPELYAMARRYITAKEYVFEQITGEQVVDYSLASGSGLLNIHTLDWDPLSLDLAGIKPDQLSQTASPLTTFRGLNPGLAEALGIPQDTLVVLGSSDAANSTLGAGATQPWQATCMVGTSGAFRTIAPRPILDPAARTWCYALDERHWLVGGAINNGGIALSWLKDVINQASSHSSTKAELSFEDLIDLAGQAGAGAGGLVCLPYFAGERSPNWNMNARGILFGLTLQHDLRHIARSLLEGVAFRLRSLSEILSELSEDIREVRASGGFSHSTLWSQIIASAIGRKLLVPAWGETSSLGAAFWAMQGAGALALFEKAGELVSIGDQYSPRPDEVAVYDRLYQIYTGLYASSINAFDQIAEIQQEIGPSEQEDTRT